MNPPGCPVSGLARVGAIVFLLDVMLARASRRPATKPAAGVLIAAYVAGFGVDFAARVATYLTTGNQQLDIHEILISFRAGLFWPMDLLVNAAWYLSS